MQSNSSIAQHYFLRLLRYNQSSSLEGSKGLFKASTEVVVIVAADTAESTTATAVAKMDFPGRFLTHCFHIRIISNMHRSSER